MEELNLDEEIKTLERKKQGKITLVMIEVILILIMPIIMPIIFIATNNNGGCTTLSDMSQEQVAAFNSKFLKYEGTKNGATARALCDAVRTNNTQNVGDESKRIVLTEAAAAEPATADAEGTETETITMIKNKINVVRRYKITFGYTATGLIKNIGIEPQ